MRKNFFCMLGVLLVSAVIATPASAGKFLYLECPVYAIPTGARPLKNGEFVNLQPGKRYDVVIACFSANAIINGEQGSNLVSFGDVGDNDYLGFGHGITVNDIHYENGKWISASSIYWHTETYTDVYNQGTGGGASDWGPSEVTNPAQCVARVEYQVPNYVPYQPEYCGYIIER